MVNNTLLSVSVIMPVYNDADYLAESLDSFFSQTLFPECELVCIDDGSTDSSRVILDEYAVRFPDSIIIIEQDNAGSGIARNKGMQRARGEYISFLDADDCYPSTDTLKVLLDSAKDNGVSISGGSMHSFGADGYLCSDFSYDPSLRGQTFGEAGVIDYQDYQFDFGFQRFLYKKKLLEDNEIVFPDYRRYQDPPFFVRAMIAAKQFYALPVITYSYRATEKTIVWNEKKVFDMIAGMTEVGVLAANNNLEGLFALNISRMDEMWLSTFKSFVIDQQNIDVLEALLASKLEMQAAETSLDLSPLLAGTPSLQYEFARMLTEADSAFKDRARLNNEIDLLQSKYLDRSLELDRTLSSTTWKVGRIVTWIPRKAVDIFRSINSDKS